MKRFLTVTLALFVLAGATQAAPDLRTVVYRSPFVHAPSGSTILNLRAKTMSGGHRIYHFETCDESSAYNCLYFRDQNFALSVPKAGMLEGTTWKIDRYRFVIRHGGAMRVGGRTLSYSIIDTIVEDEAGSRPIMRATYDPKFGLVGFADLKVEYDPKSPVILDPVSAEDIGLWPRQGN